MTDRGGVGCEPWHISYAPVAQRCLAQLDAAVLREALRSAAIDGVAEVEVRLDELLLRHVVAVDAPPQAALDAWSPGPMPRGTALNA